MKAQRIKILGVQLNATPCQREIMKPDKRFSSGVRPTGKFEAKLRADIKMVLEHNPVFRVGEIVFNSTGKFRVVLSQPKSDPSIMKIIRVDPEILHDNFELKYIYGDTIELLSLGFTYSEESSRP